MFRVYVCVTAHHDLRLVVLAGILCLFASVAAIGMLARARASTAGWRSMWLVAGAIVAGFGIWATHFVAMLAYQAGLPVGYDLWLTTASVVVAIAVSGLGLALAVTRTAPLAGGVVVGLAVGAMHYLGMAAVQIAADPVWDLRYVAASLAIGVVLSAAALQAAFARNRAFRLVAPLLLTLAICGLHFTAMSAVVYHYDPRFAMPQGVMHPETLAVVIASVAAIIVAGGLAGVLIDIRVKSREAERLRAHIVELEATKRELEQTSANLRLALAAAAEASQAKSRFLATMSHELRTPLNAILGFSELMAKEAFGVHANARYLDYSRTIHSSGTHLLGLINDILDLTRLDSGQMALCEEVVDLAEILEEAMQMVAGQARDARLSLCNEISPALSALRADPRRLRQVFLNLLSNAIKFTPVHGSVRVRAYETANGLAVEIADTGIGMAEDDIPKAMEHFGQIDSTLARRYEGSGLGLPIAAQLMALHGGSLTLQSRPGDGTTVTLTLPAERVLRAGRAAA